MKHIRITPRAAKNDLMTKAKKMSKFLEKGHRVEVNLFLKGREKANKDFGLQKLDEFLEMADFPVKKIVKPKYSRRGFTVQVTKQ